MFSYLAFFYIGIAAETAESAKVASISPPLPCSSSLSLLNRQLVCREEGENVNTMKIQSLRIVQEEQTMTTDIETNMGQKGPPSASPNSEPGSPPSFPPMIASLAGPTGSPPPPPSSPSSAFKIVPPRPSLENSGKTAAAKKTSKSDFPTSLLFRAKLNFREKRESWGYNSISQMLTF